jgi:uncharacterized protein with PQ loop repeat
MSMNEIGVVAGMLSTSLFVLSYLPMLVKAFRTKDLKSYSPGYLIAANIGNLIHSVYVASLPFGPIWFLHVFYGASSALMLCWYLRYHPRHADPSTAIIPMPPPGPAAQPTANGPPLSGAGRPTWVRTPALPTTRCQSTPTSVAASPGEPLRQGALTQGARPSRGTATDGRQGSSGPLDLVSD